MERVVREGQVATAATYAHMFSSLPSCGRPTRLMVYDLHTLQNRFYLVSCRLAIFYSKEIQLCRNRVLENLFFDLLPLLGRVWLSLASVAYPSLFRLLPILVYNYAITPARKCRCVAPDGDPTIEGAH